MEVIAETVDKLNNQPQSRQRTSSSTQHSKNNSAEQEATRQSRYPSPEVCRICNGVGWVYATDKYGDVVMSHGNKTQIVRCQCQYDVDEDRRVSYLRQIDGLTNVERQLRFETLTNNATHAATVAVRFAADQRRGMITLTGRPGTGKTTLLICAVNDARERRIAAVYTTVTDLLDYLRKAYDPNHKGKTIDQRWNLLVGAEVLALDELDEFNATPWAEERFLRLMDERWRNMDRCLTLCATNHGMDDLPDKVASRLGDGRAEVLEMAGIDMRPHLEW